MTESLQGQLNHLESVASETRYELLAVDDKFATTERDPLFQDIIDKIDDLIDAIANARRNR